jgi:hypothetical protein
VQIPGIISEERRLLLVGGRWFGTHMLSRSKLSSFG